MSQNFRLNTLDPGRFSFSQPRLQWSYLVGEEVFVPPDQVHDASAG